MKHLLALLKKLCRNIATFILALFVIFEEWGWEPLKKLVLSLGRWNMWQHIGQKIRQLPPYGALALFCIPYLTSKLISLLGLIIFFHQKPVLGGLIIALGKIIGTALFAGTYQLTLPQLLQIPWFAYLYAKWIPWKDKIVIRVKSSRIWQQAIIFGHLCKRYTSQIKQIIQRWIKH